MDRPHEVERLWGLAIPHSNGWQQDNCPIVRTGYGALESRWSTLTKAKSEQQRDDLMRLIVSAVDRQKAFRGQQRAAKEFVPNPVGIPHWLHEKRWKNDVVLQNEPEPEKKTGLCKCGVGVDVNFNLNGEPTGACWDCYDNFRKTNNG